MNYIEQNAQSGRHLMPDLVRAVALIGIALVNVSVIAYPLMGGYMHGGLNTPVDRGAFFLVMALCTMKFYPLFSFMFGVGFAYQMRSAERKGAIFARRYMRRLFGLFVLGLLHIALVFQGDVLVLYALLGLVLFLFRHQGARTLVKWGLGFYILQILVFSGLTLGITLGQQYAPDDMAVSAAKMAESIVRSQSVYGAGTFSDTVMVRLKEWSEIIQIGIFLDGLGAMAFFLFGLAAVKSDIIAKPGAVIWQRFRRVCLPMGLAGSFIGAYVQSLGDSLMSPVNMLGMTIIAMFAVFASAGYLGLIAKWAETPATRFKVFIARAGTATLTAYVMQGLILSLIFNAYGLGLYAKLDAVYCVAIAFIVSALTLCVTSLWRQHFTHGPLEHVLRKFTYLGER